MSASRWKYDARQSARQVLSLTPDGPRACTAERFEPDKGFKFSTYATYWIQQAVGRAVDNTGRPIRVPVYMNKRLRDLNRARALACRNVGHRYPSEEDIATALLEIGTELSPRKLRSATQADAVVRTPLSLDQPLRADGRDERTILSAGLADRRGEDKPREAVEADETRRALDALLEGALSEDERTSITLKYGLAGHEKHSMSQVAEKRNCSLTRANTDVQRALRKIRREAGSKGLERKFWCV